MLLSCAAIASAANLTGAKHHRAPVAQTHASKLPKLLSHPLLANALLRTGEPNLSRAIAAISAEAGTAKKRRVRLVKPFTYLVAVDGDFAYQVQTTQSVPAKVLDGGTALGLPARLVRTQISTGAKTTLLTVSRSLIYGVVAEHGHVAVTLVKIAAARNSTTIDSKILTGLHTDPSLATLSSKFARVSKREDNICGSVQLVAGLADTGEVLALDVNSDCKNHLGIKLGTVGIAADGTTRTLQDDADIDALFLTRALLNSNLLVGSEGLAGGLSAVNLETKKIERYWDRGGTLIVDQAADGSIATVPDASGFFYYLGEFDDEVSSRKANMVVFPQGNADNPVIASSTAGRTFAVHFCGSYLYELRAKGKGHWPRDDPRRLLSDFSTPTLRSEVVLRHAGGEFIKSLGLTPKMIIQGYGCNGDALQLGSSTGTKLVTRSFGP